MTLSYIPSDTNDEGILKATASGVLPNGKPVVVNSDGTVSVVAGSAENVGTPTLFESAEADIVSSAYDVNAQKVVIAYRDVGNSLYGTAVVGTVSGTSISFGTPVVFAPASTSEIEVSYDANAQRVVIAYANSSSQGTAIVGTVSGTSISFGSAAVFESGSTSSITATYDVTAQKVVIAYRDENNSSYGTAVVGTISGTSISFGSAAIFESATTAFAASAYDANAQKHVIIYGDGGNSYIGTAVVGTVSGTSISFGTPVAFSSGASTNNSIAYDATAQKVVIAHREGGNSNYGTAIVGTVSGTSISFGSPVVFLSATLTSPAATYDANAEKVVVAYRDVGNSNYGTVISGEVSGTSISFDSAAVFESAASNSFSSVYDSNAQKIVIAYQDGGNSNYGTAVVYTPASTNLTASNYIGISTGGTYADGSNATVKIIGNTSDEQSGLTAGQAYYVQTDGTIGTTPADPSVFAGTAISATKLLVKT